MSLPVSILRSSSLISSRSVSTLASSTRSCRLVRDRSGKGGGEGGEVVEEEEEKERERKDEREISSQLLVLEVEKLWPDI